MLLLLQNEAVVKGFADDRSDEMVGLGTAVVSDGLELVVVDEAVGKDGIIGYFLYYSRNSEKRDIRYDMTQKSQTRSPQQKGCTNRVYVYMAFTTLPLVCRRRTCR